MVFEADFYNTVTPTFKIEGVGGVGRNSTLQNQNRQHTYHEPS